MKNVIDIDVTDEVQFLTCCGASVNCWALACGLAAENPTPAETDFPYKNRIQNRIDNSLGS